MPDTPSLEPAGVLAEVTEMLGGSITALRAFSAPDRGDSDLVKYERLLMEELAQGLTLRIQALVARIEAAE